MRNPDKSPKCLALMLCGTLLLTAAGCRTTQYGAYDSEPEQLEFLDRKVEFEITDEFYRNPNDCVVVLPLRGTNDHRTQEMVERALARYLSERVPRVIGPRHRRRLARSLAFDIADSQDWAGFATATGCANGLEAGLLQAGDDYLVVWAQRTLGLEAALIVLSDRRLLWRARHFARRSDGGLPLSPLSVAVEGAMAAGFAMDGDIRPSLVDDVVRRMTATLPDVR